VAIRASRSRFPVFLPLLAPVTQVTMKTAFFNYGQSHAQNGVSFKAHNYFSARLVHSAMGVVIKNQNYMSLYQKTAYEQIV